MISKEPIEPGRLRKITGSFSWVDHRLLGDGYLALMSPGEMLLYFFLVLVGDRHGISFYACDKICSLLKMDADQLITARTRLVEKSLLAFDGTRYQVLQLPPRRPQKPAMPPTTQTERRPSAQFRTLGEILQQLTNNQF